MHRDKKWFSKHKWWIKRAWYMDAIIPFIPIGLKGLPYNIHHMNYKRVGKEIYGIDVVALSPFTHFLVHLLGGSNRAKNQPLGKYPNLFQKIIHFWARLHILIKWWIIFWLISNWDDLMYKLSSFLG